MIFFIFTIQKRGSGFECLNGSGGANVIKIAVSAINRWYLFLVKLNLSAKYSIGCSTTTITDNF